MGPKRHKKNVAENETIVRNGRPILLLPYRYIRLLGTLIVLYNLCTLVFYVEMIHVAHHIKGHIGDYLDMIFEDGYEMVNVLGATAIVGVVLNLFVIICCLKIFDTSGKTFCMLLFVAVILCCLFLIAILCLIIYILIYAYTMNTESMEILYAAMSNYSTNGLMKARLDTMQIELQCCGCRNYTDWYKVPWYDTNFIQLNSMNIKVVGEAPFSCCNIRTTYPCIHHGVEAGFGDYKYHIDANFSLNVEGCWNVMEDRKTKSGWMVAGYLFTQFVLIFIGTLPLRLLQTASNERSGFELENHIYTSWLWGTFVGNKETKSTLSDIED